MVVVCACATNPHAQVVRRVHASERVHLCVSESLPFQVDALSLKFCISRMHRNISFLFVDYRLRKHEYFERIQDLSTVDTDVYSPYFEFLLVVGCVSPLLKVIYLGRVQILYAF